MNSEQLFGAMDTDSVSKSFFIATSRVSDLMTELYESLHSNKGQPVTDLDDVTAKVNAYKRVLRSELDLIVTAVQQYNEGKDS